MRPTTYSWIQEMDGAWLIQVHTVQVMGMYSVAARLFKIYKGTLQYLVYKTERTLLSRYLGTPVLSGKC